MRRAVSAAIASLAIVAAMVPVRAAGAPRGVHVAFGADPTTTATIAWFTDGTDEPGTAVEYGPTEALGDVAEGAASKVFGVDALVHEVSLTGLTPGARIYYRAGGASGFTPIRSFRTAPAVAEPFRFTVFGDHGVKAQSRATSAAVLERAPAFHLVAGDISYAQPGDGGFPRVQAWDEWFDQNEPLASSVPLMAAPGNHENESIGGTQSFRTRFALPGAELFYSFDYLNVHVLVLQSDVTAAAREAVLPPMLAFAEQDLADAVLRRQAGDIDFIVVVQHHPLWGNAAGAPEAIFLGRQYNTPLIALQEQLFQRYGVDVVVVAHNHHYDRSRPMVAGLPTDPDASGYEDPVGYIQVTTGGGGESLYSFVGDGAVQPASVARHRRYHFTEFSVDGTSMTVRAIATDHPVGQVLDTFTLEAA